jgi:UDP-N-acetylenolpyruvoylglucosamine reductase
VTLRLNTSPKVLIVVTDSTHANFIINQDNASADDIENLIKYIQQTVKSKYNINLETEVVII